MYEVTSSASHSPLCVKAIKRVEIAIDENLFYSNVLVTYAFFL